MIRLLRSVTRVFSCKLLPSPSSLPFPSFHRINYKTMKERSLYLLRRVIGPNGYNEGLQVMKALQIAMKVVLMKIVDNIYFAFESAIAMILL